LSRSCRTTPWMLTAGYPSLFMNTSRPITSPPSSGRPTESWYASGRSTGITVQGRAVYWNNRTGGHDSVGVTSPASTWYLPEGCTDGGFETWVLIANPGDEPVRVDLCFYTEQGKIKPEELQGVEIAGFSRRSFLLNDYIASYEVSALLETRGGEVLCERSTYFRDRSLGHDSIGATSPSPWWYLCEGCTDGGFETWVLISNPGDEPVHVNLAFHTDQGEVRPPELQGMEIPGRSRRSLNIAPFVTSYDVSTLVEAVDGQVLCERAVYWEERTGGHDSIGYVP